jgi:hypothetical protein
VPEPSAEERKSVNVPSLTAEVSLSGPDMPKVFKVSTSGSVKADLDRDHDATIGPLR